jgi:hypothetical protein
MTNCVPEPALKATSVQVIWIIFNHDELVSRL